jgi:hypothetical protein
MFSVQVRPGLSQDVQQRFGHDVCGLVGTGNAFVRRHKGGLCMIAISHLLGPLLVVIGMLGAPPITLPLDQTTPRPQVVAMFVAVGSAASPDVPVWQAPRGELLRTVPQGTLLLDLEEARFADSFLYQRVGLPGGADGWITADRLAPTALPADLVPIALTRPGSAAASVVEP